MDDAWKGFHEEPAPVPAEDEEPEPNYTARELRGTLAGLTARITPRRRFAAIVPLLAALCLWFILPSEAASVPPASATVTQKGSTTAVTRPNVESVPTPGIHPLPSASTEPQTASSTGGTSQPLASNSGVTVTPVTQQQYSVLGLATPETGTLGLLALRSLIVAIALVMSGIIIVSGLRENPHRLEEA